MRVCMQVADIIEREVVAFLERFTTVTQTVCRTVVRAIEEWHRRWEERWVTVTRQACSWLPWPFNLLCRWITEQIRLLVEVIVRVVRTVVETICEIVTSIVRSIVRVVTTVLITIIRFVCFWVGFIANWIRIIVRAIAGIPEFLTCLLGLRIRKHLGLCVTVLADVESGNPVVDDATVTRTVEGAARIILERTNVRLREHDRRVIGVPRERLTVTACNAGQLFSTEAVDLSGEGHRSARFGDFLACGRELGDIVAELITPPLSVIFIADIVEGNDIGCHIPGTDYVIIDRRGTEVDGPATLAHEVGHACDLWHIEDNTNLMNPSVGGTAMRPWQVCIFRRARFVSYFGGGIRL